MVVVNMTKTNGTAQGNGAGTDAQPYNPWHCSSGMEYMVNGFCARCKKRDKAAGLTGFQPGCDIQAQAEWAWIVDGAPPPPEWLVKGYVPRCTAFVADDPDGWHGSARGQDFSVLDTAVAAAWGETA